MKNSIFALFALAFSTLSLFAQTGTRSWGQFSMIPTTFSDRAAAADYIKSGPAYEKAHKVYQALCEARGDLRYPVPVFIFTKDQNTVAKISYEKPEKIFFGEKAFRVCESFKDQSEAAMAFLIGHELTHYYEKHAWRGDFEGNNRHLKISKELDSLATKLSATSDKKLLKAFEQFNELAHKFGEVAMEAQSDYLGGFLAYSAGYGSFERGDSLISRLYREFGLEDEMEGYVTRAEREAMSRSSAERMKDLVEVFDMANLLSAIGRYEEAYQYYRFLLAEYQSREVYNNVGATAMMQALKLFSVDEQSFRYPIQLDLELAKSRGDDDKTKRRDLLQQAVLHFDAAISLDPKYAPAYLNKACALALLDEDKRAYFYADVEARSVAVGKYALLQNDVEVLLGILDARSKTPEGIAKAKKRLSEIAAKKGGELAAYNLAIANGGKAPEPNETATADEEIDGRSVFTMEPDIDPIKAEINVGQGLTFIRNPKKTDNAQLYTSKSSKGYTKFHITNSGYSGKTAEGIGVGASRDDILKAYKAYSEDPKTIKTITGEILVYKGVLFMLNNGKLDRWVVYAEADPE